MRDINKVLLNVLVIFKDEQSKNKNSYMAFITPVWLQKNPGR